MSETVESLARMVGGRVEGDGSVAITGVADVASAGSTDIGFVRDPRYAELARETRAGALLVAAPLQSPAQQIVVEDPHAAFAKVALHFHPVPRAQAHSIHPTAIVHADAELAEPVEVQAYVTVGAGTKIGAGTFIQAGTVIGRDVTIGRDCTIFPRVVLYDGVTIGDRVILHSGAVLGADGFGYVIEKNGVRNKFPQLGSLFLGDDVEIGANTTIDRGALNVTTVGKGTKIDNLCHVAHNCTIGSNTTVSALGAFAAGTRIGDRVIIAGHVVSAGVRITDDVIVGGNSGVNCDILEPGEYAGFPVMPRQKHVRTLILHSRLAELAAEVKDLRRRLEEARPEDAGR